MTTKALYKFISCGIVIAPLFLQYVFILDVILLPEVFIGLMAVLAVVYRGKFNPALFKWHFFYLLLIFSFGIFSFYIYEHFNVQIFASTFFRYAFYIFFVVFVSYRYFDFDYGLRCLLLVSFTNSIYGIAQFLTQKIFGIILPWYLPFLKIRYGTELIENSEYYFSEFGYRFSGIFSEPAHFSQYVGFALLISVLHRKIVFSITLDFVIKLAMFMSLLLNSSGTGFILVVLVIIAFVFRHFSGNKRDVLAYFSVFLIIPLAVGVVVSFSDGFTRIFSIEELSTTYIRIIRPYLVFYELPWELKLFGVGYGNYEVYIRHNGLMTIFEINRDIVWANSGAFILVGSGIMSFIVYNLHHFHLFLRSDLTSKFILVFIMMHLLYSDLPLSIFYVTTISFVLAQIRDIRKSRYAALVC